jgi:tripartite-type tricarboxylate transporter receptor subunit TctC
MNRRLALALAGLLLAVVPAAAQDWPTKTVRIIVPFGPGSTPDMVGRLIADHMQQKLGQPFVIENRPGASANLATEAVVRAPPDGYTLLQATSANAINATLYDGLDYNFIRDITPVASIGRVPNVMAVHPSFPAETLPAFIAYAKANPGKINIASAGNGSPSQLAGALFKMMAGVDLVDVPYRGAAPALTDLLGGRVQVYFGTTPSSIAYIRAGKLRALGVSTQTRSDALPDIPAVGDFVPGYEASTWYGIGAPKATPAEIVDQLNQAINAGLADPAIKARLADLGAAVLAGSAADFGKLIADETAKWGRVIRAADIRPE